MTSHRSVLSFDAQALMARRVLPVAMTVVLWSALIEAARLIALAL